MKPKNRLKALAPEILITTRADLDRILFQIADITLRRNAIITELDAKILALKTVVERDLTSYQVLLDQRTEAVHAWAKLNPGEFPGGKKSLDTVHAEIGWRTGNPTVKTLKGWTLDKALETMKRLATRSPGWKRFIRTKEEIDKQALIAKRKGLAKILAAVGLEIRQEETFYIDPKLEQPSVGTKSEIKNQKPEIQ